MGEAPCTPFAPSPPSSGRSDTRSFSTPFQRANLLTHVGYQLSPRWLLLCFSGHRSSQAARISPRRPLAFNADEDLVRKHTKSRAPGLCTSSGTENGPNAHILSATNRLRLKFERGSHFFCSPLLSQMSRSLMILSYDSRV